MFQPITSLRTLPAAIAGHCHVKSWLYIVDYPSPSLDQHLVLAMAPLPIDDVRSLKRSSSTANLDLPTAKKQHLRPARHHHKLQWKPHEATRHQLSPQDEESARFLLTRSIALALEAVGFESADPVAIESFRAEVEECTTQALAQLATQLADKRRYAQLFKECSTIHATLPAHTTHTA